MELADQIVVITGAGSGIGAALAARCHAEGAAGVVVSDRDGEAAARVAAPLAAVADATDVADGAAVASLVERTLARFGRIDLFCSNAGITTRAGVEDPIAAWQRAYDVHVLAHVHAARAVLPSMLARGRGYLVSTASAAGLLTAPGDAPYTVTKHAAVGLAEWLAVTYGDRGIRVSVVCPLGVATPLLMGPLADGDPAARTVQSSGAILDAEEVASCIVEGIRAERFLILPHPEVATYWAQKVADPDRWLAGVRRLAKR